MLVCLHQTLPTGNLSLGSSIFILVLISYFSTYCLIPRFSPLFAHLHLSTAVACPFSVSQKHTKCMHKNEVGTTYSTWQHCPGFSVRFFRVSVWKDNCDTVTEDLVFVSLLLARVGVGLAFDSNTVWNHNACSKGKFTR